MINPNITGSLSISLKSRSMHFNSVERDLSRANPNNARDNLRHAIFPVDNIEAIEKGVQQNPIMLYTQFAYEAFADKPNNVLVLQYPSQNVAESSAVSMPYLAQSAVHSSYNRVMPD